jgi:hypothetical protein
MESQAKAALGTVTDGFEQLKADGFLKHFQEYNVELIRPLKPATELGFEGLKKAIVGYFTPSHSKLQAQVGFILFNVLTFWFGALEAVLTFSITSLLLNACLSYIIACALVQLANQPPAACQRSPSLALCPPEYPTQSPWSHPSQIAFGGRSSSIRKS